MYYLCSETKGADQLRGYREADLRLCFCIWKKTVFLRRGSNDAYPNQQSGLYRVLYLHFVLRGIFNQD